MDTVTLIGKILRADRLKRGYTLAENAASFSKREPKEITASLYDMQNYEAGRVTMPGDKLFKFFLGTTMRSTMMKMADEAVRLLEVKKELREEFSKLEKTTGEEKHEAAG